MRGGLPPAVARRRGCAFMLSACGPLLARLGGPWGGRRFTLKASRRREP